MRVTFRFYLASIFIGIIGGSLCVAFRYLIYWIDNIRVSLFKINGLSDFKRLLSHEFTAQDILFIILKYLILFLITIFFLNIIYRLVQKFPTTSGSGLPQTKALLEKKMEYKSPLKNILAKFFGGVLSISSGLSFGREGSSVQMGSLIGFIFGKSLKVEKDNQNYLIAAGAGAGISAAFTAPLASSILILESLKNDYTSDLKKLTISTLLSGLCAGIIAIFFFPANIYSSISIIKPELKEYQLLMIFISMAILFFPPSGIIISAYLLEGSTKLKCIGLTVVKYCLVTLSTVLPLTSMSLCNLLINLKSSSQFTKTLISASSLTRSSSKAKIPSKIIIGFGSI